MLTARYDPIARWYDDQVTRVQAPIWTDVPVLLERLLGSGTGPCLDVGCGSGVYLPRLRSLGWDVIGADLSIEQLRIARLRSPELVRADAARLPFPDAGFQAVVSVFTHTDFDDLAGAFGEAGRVLAPGGSLVYIGAHPCFGGHFAEMLPDGNLVIHPGYRDRRLHFDGPGLGEGLRRRVGIRQVTLADFLQALIDADLRLELVEEFGVDVAPRGLALRAWR